MCNGAASQWLRSPHLSEVLKSLTEEACLSEDVVVTWDLLLSGCGIADDEGKFLFPFYLFLKKKKK